LIKDKIILKFHTVPASYRFGLTAYKIYLKLSNISKDNYEEMINYLINNKEVFWIGTCKGSWDLMFGIWAKSTEDFFMVHDKILDKFSKFIQQKELSISRETFQYNRRWFYQDNSPLVEFNFGEKEPLVQLDSKDQNILNLLTDNSRFKSIEMSKRLKINPKVIAYRIKEMEKRKIIRGYKLLLNPTLMGFCTCKSFVFFKNINEEKKKMFIEYCKNLPNIINIVITFAPWDLEMMFETKTYEEYFKIMDEIKEQFKEIIKMYDSVLISSEPKQKFLS